MAFGSNHQTHQMRKWVIKLSQAQQNSKKTTLQIFRTGSSTSTLGQDCGHVVIFPGSDPSIHGYLAWPTDHIFHK